MAKGERCRNEENDSPDLDQYAKDALDEVFNKEEQSYEEFLQGFTFLKKEDVNRFKVHHSSQSSKQTGDACDKKKIGDAVVKSPSSQECHQMTENDGIPEEVLGPGSTTASILMRTAESQGGSLLQVDNFVDCEDDDEYDDNQEAPEILDPLLEDDFLSSETYSPSVPSTSSTSKSKEIRSELKLQGPGNVKADSDDDSRETREIYYLSESALSLPGEVDDQEIAAEQDGCSRLVIMPNLRQLQISTRLNDSVEKNDSNLTIMESEDTDEVQPFTLDTDFDYDNVALTPKFSFVPKHTS